MSALKVLYEGTDIYPDISVGRCWHDMYAWGAIDTLTIDFGDTRNLWDTWHPVEGDEIALEDGAARTGRMYVSSVVPQSSHFTVRAYSAPQSMRERRCKSWESVRLYQLIAEIAGRHGLAYETYGMSDVEYQYVAQDNESDLEFLDRRLTYEGAAMVVYDGKIVCYSGQWAESQASEGSITVVPGNDYEFRDDSARSYGSCTVTDGTTSATFSAGDGKNLLQVVPERMSSQGEAERFAKGLLRKANRAAVRLTLRTDSMLRQYAAGSVLDLDATAAHSWSGKAFVSRMRHDYYDSKAKLWLIKPLEGY